jgi:hypothetical protein
MRVNVLLFGLLSCFFALCTAGYTVWSVLVYGVPEWTGSVGLAFATTMGAWFWFYLSRTHHAQGVELPQDRIDADIDDDDPEMGFFSPYSWWPVTLAAVIAVSSLGIAVGSWLSLIALPLFIIAVAGWVFEYYRGLHAR